MPAVTRIGDADVAHCSGMTRAAGSGNVFVNGIGVSTQDTCYHQMFHLVHHIQLLSQVVHQQ